MTHGAVHFSPRFPFERAICGASAPAAGQWRYVDCIPCLERAPDDPRIKARLDQVRAAAAGAAEPSLG